MYSLLIKISAFILSGLIFRLLASIGFGLATAAFIGSYVERYLYRSINEMNTALSPDVAAYMNIARLDDCINIIIGTITFISTYKALKIVFVRQQ